MLFSMFSGQEGSPELASPPIFISGCFGNENIPGHRLNLQVSVFEWADW